MEIITPPKDDEMDTPLEVSDSYGIEPQAEVTVAEAEAIETYQAPEEKADDLADEIVVEPEAKGPPIEDDEGEESSLSSAPASDDEGYPSDTAPKAKQAKPSGETCEKLGDVSGLKERLDRRRGDDELLKTFHRILYKRPGTAHEVKKNIREFKGFHFIDEAARDGVHDRLSKLFMGGLKEICTLLGLPVSGGKESLLNGIVEMLNQPYDTKKHLKTKKRRSSGKVSKRATKKKSSDSLKPKKKVLLRLISLKKVKKAPSPERSEEQEEPSSEEEAPPKKKRKAAWKPKVSEEKVRSDSPYESSDDNKPLRPGPSDADIKAAIKEFLKGKDLSTITKGMVKEALRAKYGEAIIKTKKSVISEGIDEGMQD